MNTKSEKFFQQERQMWLETLTYIQQSTAQLKNLLTEVIKDDITDQPLNTIEQFQTRLLNEDAMIGLLRRDVSIQSRTKGESDIAYSKQQEKLRHDMQRIEENFSQLKLTFSNYLCQIL